jgi:ribosomal protein S12 methylthiotransferase
LLQESIDKKVINTITAHDNICSYFDIPIQHASNTILKRMGRRYSKDDLKRLFYTIRSSVPDASLRTTALVGFPGETDEDFETLLEFIEEIRFDHLGVFTYSDANEILSHRLPDHVDSKVSEERYNRLMSCQADISLGNNKKHKNRTYKVLVENGPENGHYIGRTSFQAPEVDGITFIRSDEIEKGSFIMVKITDFFEYDLAGVPV